ncbi:MAG: hypothetical protein CMB64_06445, partial [Euryarchaeota archaeon]|nr:hypothetical protein [Euryarchaeota archaeon]
VDELPKWREINGPPSPKKLVIALRENGFKASISSISTPAIQTDAPWNELTKIVKEMDSY